MAEIVNLEGAKPSVANVTPRWIEMKRDGKTMWLDMVDGHFAYGGDLAPTAGARLFLAELGHLLDVQHASDCAVHNEPAKPNGLCDCHPEDNPPQTARIAKLESALREIASWQNAEGVGGQAIRLARKALNE